MAIVITNGKYYIWYTKTGATRKVSDINLAYQFPNVSEAINGMKKARGQTKKYYVFDTLTQRVLWKWMTQAELDEIRKNRLSMSMVKRDSNGKIKRKQYSQDTRKLIYNRAGCRCELCGRKLLFEDATIDHVIPLSKGGIDDVENLACVCYEDNQFKNNILPEDFLERITKIFMYQMEKKNGNSVRWKIVYRMLKRMV